MSFITRETAYRDTRHAVVPPALFSLDKGVPMMFWQMFHEAGLMAKLSLLMAVVPLGAGIVYAIRPTEAKLALMRPLCLAGLFASICGSLAGVLNMLRFAGASNLSMGASGPLIGLSESLVPLFVGCGSLSVAWLCVALGLRRQT
jgi:hypothetical protein